MMTLHTELSYPYTAPAKKGKRSRRIKRTHKEKCKMLGREILKLLGKQHPHSTPSLPARVSQEPVYWDDRELLREAITDPENDYYW